MLELREIPRIPTSLEVMLKVCEIVEGRTVKELVEILRRKESTVYSYLKSMERLGLVKKNERRWHLREAGREFLRLAKEKEIGEALYQAIITCGNPSDLIIVLRTLAEGGRIDRDKTFIENWKTFLKHLKLLNEKGQLTPNGRVLLNSENIVEELRRYPSLLARKIVYCPCYEFQTSDMLYKIVQHNLEMLLVVEKLERLGFRRISVKLQYGNPDGVLTRDGKFYIHEHKTGKLDEIAFIQALLYSKEYEEEYGELPGIVLTNSSEVRIYEREHVIDSVRILNKVINLVARNLIARKYSPGYYCYYCGNTSCPHNQKTF